MKGHPSNIYDDLDRGVAELIHKKSPQASRFHKNANFLGRPMSEWFGHPLEFVSALKDSHYITPGDSGESLLTSSFLEHYGCMYMVFTDSEKMILSNWINAIPASQRNCKSNLWERIKSLLATKARSAPLGLHRKFLLNGEPLSSFFSGSVETLVSRLSQSQILHRFVESSCSGKMSNVFSEEEKQLLTAWEILGFPLE